MRDVFLFCCFTGLRYSDVYNLRTSDVKADHIEITTVKTADSLVIELNNHSKAILEKLVALFVDASSEAGQIAIEGFPYFATGIIFFILNVAIVGYYQSVEQIKRATIFVFLRGFALLVPCFILLPKLLGTEGIWLAMPLAELMTTTIIVIIHSKIIADSAR